MTTKDTGPKAGGKGVVEGVKGRAKEVVGAMTGDESLRREGIAQQRKADAQRDVARKELDAEKARTEAAAQELEQRRHQD